MRQIKVSDEADFYNPLDPMWTQLSDSVYAYLRMLYRDMNADEIRKDTLRVICPKPINEQRIATAIRTTVDKQVAEYEKTISDQKREMTVNYVVGLILTVLGVVGSVLFDALLLQFISFFGGFVLRDAVTIHFRTLPKTIEAKEQLEPIRDITIEGVLAEG